MVSAADAGSLTLYSQTRDARDELAELVCRELRVEQWLGKNPGHINHGWPGGHGCRPFDSVPVPFNLLPYTPGMLGARRWRVTG